MKINLLLLAALLALSSSLNAQKIRSPFRKGYIRLGINTLGQSLDQSLSPRDNVFAGRFGADPGYSLETGHIFYFLKASKAKKFNYGLDWTIFSAGYNKLGKWNAYATASNVPDASVDGTTLAVSAASRLGPVLSFNPVEKLVIDLRFQIAPTWRFFNMKYAENQNNANQRSFSFENLGQEEIDTNYNASDIRNRIAFGVEQNLGIGIRRKAIGMAVDYIWGKTNSSYDAVQNGSHTFGKQKLPVKSLQLKLSFTL